jgi:hypothetical protein
MYNHKHKLAVKPKNKTLNNNYLPETTIHINNPEENFTEALLNYYSEESKQNEKIS